MELILLIFLGITVAFFGVLGIREIISKNNKEKICSICFAVSLTWIILLFLFYAGKFLDKTILAILIGQSSLGIFYLWERTTKDKTKVFRLPLLLSLVLFAYTLIEGFLYSMNVLIFLGILWVLFFGIYIYGSESKAGGIVRKLVECCKKW